MVGETRALANFCAKLSYEDLPPTVVEKVKECLLDWLGSALAGSSLKPAAILVSLVEEFGGTPESTLINHKGKTSCINAALVNGVMSHIIELDDVHRDSILHPAAPVIPAALALSEKLGANGRTFIDAIVAGYETAIRIGEAVGTSHYKFWHNTGTCGTFGAAVAAGKVLGLDEESMAYTLGNAGTQASGLWEFLAEGAMSKHLHPGKAASNGVLSALLAQKGFTGSTTILEGERGFCPATSRDYKLEKITEGLGKKYKILETSFKIHASCRHTHPAVDAAIQIHNRVNPKYIETVSIETYSDALDIAGIEEPRTTYEAKFCLNYCVSVALFYGRLGLDEFNEGLLMDPRVRSLMRSTNIIIDPVLDGVYPARWPSRVEVVTKKGQRYRASVDYPLGDPENPLPVEKLRDKFRILASKALPKNQIEAIIETVFKLENLTTVRQLTEKFH